MAHVQALNRETLGILSGIERMVAPGDVKVDFQAGMELHNRRMAHIREKLDAFDEKLRRLMNLL